MFSINLRAFTLLMSLGLGVCVMASGCFSCTDGSRAHAAAWFINDDHDYHAVNLAADICRK
jgi:hypothetical protein